MTYLPKKMNVRFYTLLLLLVTLTISAQQGDVKTEVDRNNIKIGEQIKYQISVETGADDNVQFPEGQTFNPLEMVRSTAVDTFREQEKIRLVKAYYLTQFDSGAYTIPPQKILIDTNSFYTDSLRVLVQSVAVDTLKQPMYDIKPIIEVKKTSTTSSWYFILGIALFWLLLLALVLYFFIFRKKKLTEEERRKQLPPFERAILELKELQNSKYLIESKHKEYYSELTDIVREYLEDEVHISAKESTTDKLLMQIQLLQEAGKLNLTSETVSNLKRVLSTADLVKFAKNKPSDFVAESDRTLIEDVVVKTKEAIPEPTIEEKLKNQAYLEELARKKQKRKNLIIRLSIVGFFILALLGLGTYYGFGNLKDKVFGNYTRELYEGRWVTSKYGFPPTQLQTPEVLVRRKINELQGYNAIIEKQVVFDFGSINSDIYIMTNIIRFAKQQPEQSDNPEVTLDVEKVKDVVLQQLERAGAENMTTLQEEYTTAKGVKGVKLHGTMTLINEKTKDKFRANYNLYSFTENGALQQLLITYADGDRNAYEIAERVVHSIDFKRE